MSRGITTCTPAPFGFPRVSGDEPGFAHGFFDLPRVFPA